MRELVRLMDAAPMPAVGVSVFDRDEVLFQEVRGAAGPGDWWDLASLTKVLVTLPAVLGTLPLDAPLASLWPRAAPFPVGRATVRHLLAHNAGLPPTAEFYRRLSGRAAIVEAALATPLVGEPGGEAIYSDLGYLLLGELISAGGNGLRFGPLPGPAVPTEECAWRGRLIAGEVHDENAWAMGGRAGHAGAFGTLELVTEVARDWFGDRVVSPVLHEEARLCQATNAQGERFGLGWWLSPTRGLGGPAAGPGSYGASGFVGNRIWFEPARGYGVVVLSNRTYPVRGDRAPFQQWMQQLLAAVAGELRRPITGGDEPSPSRT